MIQPFIVEEIKESREVWGYYPQKGAMKARIARSFWKIKEKGFPVGNPENLELEKGDIVEIAIRPRDAIGAAFLVFVLPLLSFLLFYGVGRVFSQREGILFFIAFLGLTVGVGVNGLLYKIRGRGKLPVIRKKYSPQEAADILACEDSSCGGCGGCG